MIFFTVEASNTNERVSAELPDVDLVRLACEWRDTPRGRRAASALLNRYRGHVYRWCRKHLRDSDRALDMAQEVLLSAYRNLSSFGERARFSSWLFAIARNRCLSVLRRPSLLTEDDTDLVSLPDPTAGPDQQTELRDDEDRLWRLLGTHLTNREREALWLQCIEDFSIDEITEALTIEGSTGARGVLQNARRKLRDVLKQEDLRREVEGHG